MSEEIETKLDDLSKRLTILETSSPLEIKNLSRILEDIKNDAHSNNTSMLAAIDKLTASVNKQAEMNEVFRGVSSQQMVNIREININKVETARVLKLFEDHVLTDTQYKATVNAFIENMRSGISTGKKSISWVIHYIMGILSAVLIAFVINWLIHS